jgi:hypothetical protein
MNVMPRVAAMLALCGAIIGFAASLFVPHRYLASARLAFVSPYDANAQMFFDDASEATLNPRALELMIRQSPNFKDQLYIETVTDVIAEVRAGLTLKLSGTVGTVEYEDDNPDTALEVTRVVLSEFGNNAARIANAKTVPDVIRIVKTPDARLTGFTPWLLTAVGMAGGLFSAFLVWLFLPRKVSAAA